MAHRATLATGAVALLAIVTACTGPPPPAPSAPGAPVAVRTVIPARDGPRPILVDTDLDADDLVALAILLGDPEVDIRAVTVSGTGIIHCLPGVDVARRWLAAFGRRDVRVACGRETTGPDGRAFPDGSRASADAGFGLDLPQARPVGASGTGEAETG